MKLINPAIGCLGIHSNMREAFFLSPQGEGPEKFWWSSEREFYSTYSPLLPFQIPSSQHSLRVAPSSWFLFVCLFVCFLCGSRQWPGFPGFPCTEDEPVQSYLWKMQLRRRVRVWLASIGQFLWRGYLPDRVRFPTLPARSLIEVHTPFLQFWNPPSSKNQRVFFHNSFGSKIWNELWGFF